MFRTILVAIDGSRTAMTALEEAIDLARREGARLELLAVAAPPRCWFAGTTFVSYPTGRELERAASEAVEQAAALVPPDIPVSTVVRTGWSPADVIVARAEERGHDLVVMGSRGRGLLASLALGSVSRAVVARSAVPVLVARGPRQETPAVPVYYGAREATAEPPPPGLGMQAKSSTSAATLFLWLVAALLLELQLALWMFEQMHTQ